MAFAIITRKNFANINQDALVTQAQEFVGKDGVLYQLIEWEGDIGFDVSELTDVQADAKRIELEESDLEVKQQVLINHYPELNI